MNCTPIPCSGAESRTIARARTSPVFRSRSSSMTVPSGSGFGVCRNNPPIPTTSARATPRCPADFQPTHVPFGVLWRGYFLCSWDVVSMVRACLQPNMVPNIEKPRCPIPHPEAGPCVRPHRYFQAAHHLAEMSIFRPWATRSCM